jgi:hypothetical protein
LTGLIAQDSTKGEQKDQEAGPDQHEEPAPELQLDESAALRAQELTQQINESAAKKAEVEKE